MVDPDGQKPVYMFRKTKDGGKDWIYLDSEWKAYKTYLNRGYSDYKGPLGHTFENRRGKTYQLTSEGFKPAVPISSGEKEVTAGNNPTVGFDIAGGDR